VAKNSVHQGATAILIGHMHLASPSFRRVNSPSEGVV